MSEQYNLVLDGPRLKKQLEVVREVMLSAAAVGTWHTLEELKKITGYPPASISADLRHLRNGTGSYHGPLYVVEKRRREGAVGLWEYKVKL
jgi:hypothetical protein